MYASVILLLCLYLVHASLAKTTVGPVSVDDRDQILNSQIKDQGIQIAKLTALVVKLESEIEKMSQSQATTPTPSMTAGSATTPLMTTGSATTPAKTTTAATTTTTATTVGPLNIGVGDQTLLLHIKDQDLKIEHQNTKFAELKALVEHQNTKFAELNVLVEHQNTKFSEENAKFSEENAKFSAENAKFAKVETKIYKLETEIEKLTNSQAATTSSPSTTTSSTQTTNLSTIDTSSGVVFTRWGRTDCPAGISTSVYNGTVGGSYESHKGAAVNYLCMPHDPTWDFNKWYKPTYNGYVYSGSYSSALPYSSLSGVAPCAVCRAESFSTKVMIPGRDRCYPGWIKAYNGELVSGDSDHTAATEYACLDKQPQKGVSGGSIAAYFYPVLAKCGLSYQNNALLTCVVCLK